MSEVVNVPLPPLSGQPPPSAQPSFFDESRQRGAEEPASKRSRTEPLPEGALVPLASLTNESEGKDEPLDRVSRPMYTVAQVHKICERHDFFMVLHNSTPFKDLVDLISPVLGNINFKVVDRPLKNGQRFRGLVVNNMNDNKVTMIVARLRADELFPDSFPDQEFCISSENFSNLIKTIKKGCCLEIKREKNSNEIKIRGYNPNRKNRVTEFCVPTLDRVEDAPALNSLDYKFFVDIDLPVLRNMTRVATSSSVNAKNIRFQIYEHVDESQARKTTKICVSLHSGHDTPTMTEIFRSVTQWNRQTSEQTVITSSDTTEDDLEDDGQMALVLDERFSTKYLHQFFKSMDRQTITLRMSPDRPLVIIYHLDGGENIGYCNFILAPTMKGDDE